MIRINLLPFKAAQKKEQLKSHLVVAGLSLVLLLATFGAFYTLLQTKVDTQKDEITRKEDELHHLRKKIGEVRNIKKLQKELQAKLDVLDKLKADKSGPVHLLDELGKAVSKDVWITTFKESGGSISIQGVGLNEEVVAQFLKDLEKTNRYTGVELLFIEQKEISGLKLHRFSLSCSVETPAASPKKK